MLPELFQAEKLTEVPLLYENCAFISHDVYYKIERSANEPVYIKVNNKVIMVKPGKQCTGETLYLSQVMRGFYQIQMLSKTYVAIYALKPNDILAYAMLEIHCGKPITTIDTNVLFDSARKHFNNCFLYPGCTYCLEYEGLRLDLTLYVRDEKNEKVFEGPGGIFNSMTAVAFSLSSKFKPDKKPQLNGDYCDGGFFDQNPLTQVFKRLAENEVSQKKDETLQIDVNPLGIGGLNKQFTQIFRRAFVSRMLPLSIIRRYKMYHVRGMLLFGPPGTGKTLIARKIGTLLNAREPKIISGPDIMDKYFGESENNVRKLFVEAEKEWAEAGDESGLHMIIIDELDAICKQRGNRADSTGIGDSIVNYLLAKMDGVEQLGNILIIGMTNRKDMIDTALLRPGRFEVLIEIHLPNQQGRLEILKIHTAELENNKALAEDVDLQKIAEKAVNFSGAEISGLIRSAQAFAASRVVNGQMLIYYSQERQQNRTGEQAQMAPTAVPAQCEFIVTARDFEMAFEEVHAGYGRCDAAIFDQVQQFGYYSEGGHDEIVESILNKIQTAYTANMRLLTLLVHSREAGTGKSSILAEVCRRTSTEFVKFISARTLVQQAATENGRGEIIQQTFEDAGKVPYALIVLDNLEQIVQYASLGARYSNIILQTIIPLLRNAGNGCVVVLCSTNQYLGISDLGLAECFIARIPVGPLDYTRQVAVIRQWAERKKVTFKCGDFNNIKCLIDRCERNISVTIRQLLTALELAGGAVGALSADKKGSGEISEMDFAVQLDECCSLTLL